MTAKCSTHLASASSDQTVIIWETNTWGQETVLNRHSDTIRSVAWHPNGSHLASVRMTVGDADREIREVGVELVIVRQESSILDTMSDHSRIELNFKTSMINLF